MTKRFLILIAYQFLVFIFLISICFILKWDSLDVDYLNYWSIAFQFLLSLVIGLFSIYSFQDSDRVLGVYAVLGGSTIKILLTLLYILLIISRYEIEHKLIFVLVLFSSYFSFSVLSSYFLLRINDEKL